MMKQLPLKILAITLGAIIVVGGTGALTWFLLHATVDSSEHISPDTQQSVDPVIQKAQSLEQAANENIRMGNVKEGIDQLKEARSLYQDQKDSNHVRMIDLQIDYAKNVQVPDQPEGPYIEKTEDKKSKRY